MEANRVKVQIFGQTYTINGDAPREYIIQLAEFLNRKMEEVSAGSSNSSTLQVAILAALNVADEYYQLKKLSAGWDGEMEKRTKALISLLDEGLIGDFFSRASVAAEQSTRQQSFAAHR